MLLRAIIKICVNAKEDDKVIFCGSGATGTIHKLINAIQLKDYSQSSVRSTTNEN